MSRDGKLVAYTAQEETFNLEVAPFDAEAGRPMGPSRPLTAGAQKTGFQGFSPDGRSVVFASGEKISRLDADGGSQNSRPIKITSMPRQNGRPTAK